ncbi:hypothetical protein KCU81_g3257, partial [Aureobasidium melanogenum]|uniref:Uncharacterized protein n=1 Tax=Aureobasidium melanogenum (strain CBS 110374) TaxID=1043003 RepID=A0A074VMI7_AURM1
METDQNDKSKDSIGPPQEPVDFGIRSEHGLGQFKRFPREIRNIIYSSMVPSLMVHGLKPATIDRCVVRKLVQTPILATSKQLCVEFLEVFMREVNLEESDEHHHSDNKRAECLEELLAFVKTRINIRSERNNSLGLKLNWSYFFLDAAGLLARFKAQQTKQLPRKLQRLWDIHEKFGVPSDKIYINIDYHDPKCWIDVAVTSKPHPFPDLPETFWHHEFEHASARVTLSDKSASMQAMADMDAKMRSQMSAYKASKLHQFRTLCNTEKDLQLMEENLDWILGGLEQHPLAGLLKLHSSMSEMAINFWKPREEQYSVWHLFDPAETWAEAR